MANKTNLNGDSTDTPIKNRDEMENFKSFIKKKKSQNEVLKKIISKLHVDKDVKSNK